MAVCLLSELEPLVEAVLAVSQQNRGTDHNRIQQNMGTGLDCHDESTVALLVSQQNTGTEHIRTWAQA